MKKLIIGLIIGLMLGMSTNAFAAIGDVVSATFASFNYVVNGTAKAIDSPVLVYDGVSYVRTTDIGNMLGYDVTYKSDTRTIELDGGTNTTISTPSPTPTSTVTDTTYTATPTPSPTVSPTDTSTTSATPTPDPNATPTPTPDPNATPSPTPTAAPIPTPTATPAPLNLAECQAIRDSYQSQIVMVGYEGGSEAPKRSKILVLEYNRDQELSAAGCN